MTVEVRAEQSFRSTKVCAIPWPPYCGRSADAGHAGGGSGQRVDGTAGDRADAGFDRPTLAGPILKAAEHLLDRVAEPGELHSGLLSAVAARAPAVDDHGLVPVDQLGGLLG